MGNPAADRNTAESATVNTILRASGAESLADVISPEKYIG
jgi:hypothetical protein